MTFFQKTRNTGWYIGGAVAAMMMILLVESSVPPRNEIAKYSTKTAQKDYRPILKNIKTIPEPLIEEKAKPQALIAKRLSGAPAPTNGPMMILSRMEEVHATYLDQFDISIIEIPAGWDADWLLQIVQKDPSVDYAGVDRNEYILPQTDPPRVRPNDPDFIHQTNLHDPVRDVDVDAPEAWAYTTGSDSVVVAVLDSGIDITNPDLIPNLWINSSEVAGNNIDDDMNGCVDDIHGCNVRTRNTNGMIGDDRNRQFHGTGVSGVLGARGNDNYGVAGVAWNIRIMTLKATGGGEGDNGFFLRAYNYILTMRNRGINIRVMNHGVLSDGFRNCNPDNLYSIQRMQRDCIRDLGEAGILVVAPTGNSGINFDEPDDPYMLFSPSCYRLNNIINVAGQSEATRTRWSSSNYGSVAADLFAPAENVYAYHPVYSTGRGASYGTSLAAPHVAGAAALLWSFRPDMTVTDVRNTLLNTVDRFPAFENAVASGGALNIANALYSVATPGIRVHSSQTTIAEGTSGYIDLSLTREPVRPSSGEVVVLQGDAVMLSSADAVVTPSTLTFTSANWHIPQRMTVRAAGTSGSEVMLQVSVDRHLSTTHYEGIRRTATMTLQSDGIRPTLHIPARIAEGDTATATIRFSDPLISTAQFTITATGDSTAAEGENYTLPGPITATPGDTSATFAIRTIEEAGYNGPDKTIHLRVTTDNPHILREALPLPATLTIEDKDTPIMTITVFPRTITQSNIPALAPTATATIQLDRRAVSDVRVLLNARTSRRGGDISHLFYNIGDNPGDDSGSNIWPASATIVENATATEIIIHSLDYDNDLGPSHWIRLSPTISDDAAARLGEPRWATLRTRDDDGDSDTYIRLRVFLEGAIPSTPVDTIQASP